MATFAELLATLPAPAPTKTLATIWVGDHASAPCLSVRRVGRSIAAEWTGVSMGFTATGEVLIRVDAPRDHGDDTAARVRKAFARD